MGPIGREKRHTKLIGEISEAAIIARFLQIGYVVLTPYGGNQRYDLVIEMQMDGSGAFNVKLGGLMRMEWYSSLTHL